MQTRNRFDVILTESFDRLKRDQEDIAGLYKRMRFASVRSSRCRRAISASCTLA